MSTHTPGPWVVRKDSSVETKEGLSVAGFVDNPKDASLIAAAPELLKALKDYQAYFESMSGHPCNSVSRNAKAIIAKAEGYSQRPSKLA